VSKVLTVKEIAEIVLEEGSIKTLPQLIKKVKAMYDRGEDATRYYEGHFKNTRWRLFGPHANSDAKGQLQLANYELFDRWANSVTITIYLSWICHEEGSFKNVITNVFNIY
jgi:hypothetical protein